MKKKMIKTWWWRLFRRLKNIEKKLNRNNNDKNKKTNDISESSSARSESSSARSESSSAKSKSSSARSESSTKTSISDDETQTSFRYLINNTEEFFLGYTNIFDSDLKELFKNIASEEKKNIDYKLLSGQILTPSKNTINFLQKYGDLNNVWFNLLFDSINLDNFKSEQIKF